MSGNIRLRGKFYHYDFMIEGKRYKGSSNYVEKSVNDVWNNGGEKS